MQRRACGALPQAWHAIGVLVALSGAAGASGYTPQESPLMIHSELKHATGTFDVTMAPDTAPAAEGLARLSLEKRYHGDLEGSGRGEMVSAGNPAQGNAGYVAIERVTGTLHGRHGSFAVMQMGTMAAGTEPNLQAVIAPGSGSGALAGITGTLKIMTDGRQHRYAFDYQLP